MALPSPPAARNDAAALGSLLFTFGSFNLLHFVHPNAVAIIAHIPWLLWAIDIVLSDSRRRKVAAAGAAIAMLTGSQLLLGYPQYVWFSLLAETGYAALVVLTRRHAARRDCGECASCSECVGCTTPTWPRVILAKGAGVLLGGAQLWPTFDALSRSTRQTADAAMAQTGSLHPLNLVQLVAPYLFAERAIGGSTHEMGLYIGAVPLMLIAWLIVDRRRLGPLQTLARATAWFAGVALVLAMGEFGQLYRLQSFLPLIDRFRCPCRYLVLFQLGAAILAAIGFVLLAHVYQRTREGERGAPNPLYPKVFRRVPLAFSKFEGLWAVVIVGGSAALTGLLAQGRPYIAPWPKVLVGPLLLAAAALLVIAAARGVRGSLIGLIVLAAVDLGCYGMSYAVYAETARLDQVPAAAVAPPAAPGGRVYAPPLPLEAYGNLWTGNQMILAGWNRLDGYAGLAPQRRLDYASLPALQAGSASWVQRDATTARIAGLTPCGNDWLQVPGALPRVRLVAKALASDDPARDIRRIDVRTTALTDFPLRLSATPPGEARLAAQRPGRLEVAVAAPGRQLLVVSESYHSGWRATIDGAPQAVLRVNGDYLGCVVGPGKQNVLLEFRPESLWRGWLASLAGLGLTAAALAWGMAPFRRPPPLKDVPL